MEIKLKSLDFTESLVRLYLMTCREWYLVFPCLWDSCWHQEIDCVPQHSSSNEVLIGHEQTTLDRLHFHLVYTLKENRIESISTLLGPRVNQKLLPWSDLLILYYNVHSFSYRLKPELTRPFPPLLPLPFSAP